MRIYEKRLFERKLQELGLVGDFSRQVLKGLGDAFTLEELRTSVSLAVKQLHAPDQETEKRGQENSDAGPIELRSAIRRRTRVCPNACCFPSRPSQSNGIEDARFVLFQNEDGTRTYYATYTAYDGKDDPAAVPRNTRLSSFQIHHAERPGRRRTKAWRSSHERSRASMRCWAGRTPKTST